MKEAFFDVDMPRWIHAGVELVPEKGTPLIAYMDMRVMRQYQVAYGSIKATQLQSIQNIEAICQLEAQLRKGVELNQPVRATHSFEYAETELVQSGHQIADVRVVGGGRTEIGPLLTHYEQIGVRDAAYHNAILKKYGLTRHDVVLWDYDIDIDLVPLPAEGAP